MTIIILLGDVKGLTENETQLRRLCESMPLKIMTRYSPDKVIQKWVQPTRMLRFFIDYLIQS